MGMLSGIVFLRVAGVSLVLPGFVAFGQTLGGSVFSSGLAFAAYPLTMALALYPLSSLSDRIGRRPVLAGGLALSAIGGFVASVAPNIYVLALGRALTGSGAINGVALAVAGEIGEPDRRARRMAALGASAGGGFAVGLVLGALLLPLIGIRGLLFAHALLSVLLVPLVLRTLPNVKPVHPLVTGGRVEPRVVWLSLASFALNASMMGLLFLSPLLLAAQAPDVSYTLLLVAMVLPGGAGVFVTSRLADQGHGRAVGLVAALLLALTPMPFLGMGPASVTLLLGAGIVYFIGNSALMALLPALNASVAPEGRRGASQGLQSTLQYLGSASGSAVASAFYPDAMLLAAAFLATGAMMAVGVLVASRPP